jgi:hypothetical protein
MESHIHLLNIWEIMEEKDRLSKPKRFSFSMLEKKWWTGKLLEYNFD